MLSVNQKHIGSIYFILFISITQQTLAGNFQAGLEFGLGPSALVDFKSGNDGISLGTLAGIRTIYPLTHQRELELGLYYSMYSHAYKNEFNFGNGYVKSRHFIRLNYLEIPVLFASPIKFVRENKADLNLKYFLGISLAYLFEETYSPGIFPNEFENSGIFRKVSPQLFGGIELWEINQRNGNVIKFRSLLSFSPLSVIKSSMQKQIDTYPDSWQVGRATRNIRLLFSVSYVMK